MGKASPKRNPKSRKGHSTAPQKAMKIGVSDGGSGYADKTVGQATNLSLGDEGGQIVGKPLPLQRIGGQDVHNLQASSTQSKEPLKKKASLSRRGTPYSQNRCHKSVLSLPRHRLDENRLPTMRLLSSSYSKKPRLAPPLATTSSSCRREFCGE